MSKENPYEKYIDGRPIETILESTAASLASAVAAINPERLSVPSAPGKWSPAEIVSHLADCELAFGWRLRQILAEELPLLQPFDQEKWAANYGGITAQNALEAFTALRSWNLQLIRKSMPAKANRAGHHPERGHITFQTTIETMAGHDLNHLGQLAKVSDV